MPRTKTAPAKDTAPPARDYTIDAVVRSLEVLRAVAEGDAPHSLGELAARAGLTRSTTFRLLWNLEKAGFVLRGAEGGYALGHAVLDLAVAHRAQNGILRIAPQHVEALRDATGETTGLFLRDGENRVCVFTADSPQAVRHTLRIGNSGALWGGASGRLMLAHMNDAERRALAGGIYATPKVERVLAGILRTGVALTDDIRPDVWSIAAPVQDHEGKVVAALACTGPAQRGSPAHLAMCSRETAAAAARLTRALGMSTGRP